jgi:plastocyanin
LRQISFNLGAGTGAIIQSFANPTVANAISPIGISTNLNLLGGVAVETPDNFKLYDLPLSGAPSLIETNAFPTDNANINVVGAVDFGGDRVFALDCNNGIIALQILPPPTKPAILTNPQPQTVTVGDSVTFSVAASGTAPLAYQWRFNGANRAGETDAALNLPSVLATDAGGYSVVITNSLGAVTSVVASLTVNIPPDITTDPADLTVTPGQNATFTVAATGTAPLSYQWRFNETNIAGANTSSYTRSNTTPAHAGNYSVSVSNVAGIVSSEAATLTVNVAPAITSQPASQTVKVGSNVTFTVAAEGNPPPSYQWLFNAEPIPGAASSSFIRTNAQLVHAGDYSVVVSNSVNFVFSSNAALTVLPLAPLWLQSLTPLPDGRMTLVVTGEPGFRYAVERTTNFSVWQEITNLANPTGLSSFTDDAATNHADGFYRARQ